MTTQQTTNSNFFIIAISPQGFGEYRVLRADAMDGKSVHDNSTFISNIKEKKDYLFARQNFERIIRFVFEAEDSDYWILKAVAESDWDRMVKEKETQMYQLSYKNERLKNIKQEAKAVKL